MLDLESDRWQDLSHANGSAKNIPDLLRQLYGSPRYHDWRSEPYFSLWSSLCHQGDVYTASYAAVPHLLSRCRETPETTHWSVLQLVVHIEFARLRDRGPEIPTDLEVSYKSAISQLPLTAVNMLDNQDESLLVSVGASALAVANGQPALTEAYIELNGDTVDEFLEWFWNQ